MSRASNAEFRSQHSLMGSQGLLRIDEREAEEIVQNLNSEVPSLPSLSRQFPVFALRALASLLLSSLQLLQDVRHGPHQFAVKSLSFARLLRSQTISHRLAGAVACCTWRRCAPRAESGASTTVHRQCVFLPRLDSQPLNAESSS